MRLPGQISAAIEILAEIEARHRPASAALRDWGVSHRFAGSSDRAVIGNIVYDALRRRRSLAWRMDTDTPRALAIGVAGLKWGIETKELAAAFESDRHGPGPLSDSERSRLDNPLPMDQAPDAIAADVPDWCTPMMQAALGSDWVAEGRALAGRPPLDLRVNALKADREKVLRRLARLGAVPCDLSPVGIRIPSTEGSRRHPNIQTDEAFQRGRVEVQDEGSQLSALLTGAAAGSQVLDLCAGAGGKTLALASMMENRGQIFAYDADRNRLAGIFERLKRARVRNVQVRPPDDDALSDLENKMDIVLVDAPCSGSGVWRRHPDSKWRVSAEAVASRQQEQAGILVHAAGFVRPGGLLFYVTCSVFAEENSRQIDEFLDRHSDFNAVPLPAADSLPLHAAYVEGRFDIQLTPARTRTDAFFVAAMQRA